MVRADGKMVNTATAPGSIAIGSCSPGFRSQAHWLSIQLAAPAMKLCGRSATTVGLAALGRVFGDSGSLELLVDGDLKLNVRLSDYFWMTYALEGSYEEDLAKVLWALPVAKTLFIDGGANIGWWSLLAEHALGWKVVAVEAANDLVDSIEENQKRNASAIHILHRALWSSNAQRLRFQTSKGAHAGNHLADVRGFVADWRLPHDEVVWSCTIDSIVKEHRHDAERIVVKLDVEGAEVEAIEGAHETIAAGALMIYEDHGAQTDSAPTKAMLDLGARVYLPMKQGLVQIHATEDLTRHKQRAGKGFNLFAAAAASDSADFLERLAQ